MTSPFSTASDLAEWVANVLTERGIDEVADWRMLEYWFQLELYRAVQSGRAGPWVHFGTYEQPYITTKPRSGSKTNAKWVDLVCATPSETHPETLLWIDRMNRPPDNHEPDHPARPWRERGRRELAA